MITNIITNTIHVLTLFLFERRRQDLWELEDTLKDFYVFDSFRLNGLDLDILDMGTSVDFSFCLSLAYASVLN